MFISFRGGNMTDSFIHPGWNQTKVHSFSSSLITERTVFCWDDVSLVPWSRDFLSEGEQQETRENAEVSGVVIEAVAGRQTEPDSVALLQLQSHSVGRGGVAAVVVQVQVEDDRPVVPVQVETHVAFQIICSREAEEVESSDGGCEHTWQTQSRVTLTHSRRGSVLQTTNCIPSGPAALWDWACPSWGQNTQTGVCRKAHTCTPRKQNNRFTRADASGRDSAVHLRPKDKRHHLRQ